jgi:Raf kinase inhibitor-like YbhB/YbcL family protein
MHFLRTASSRSPRRWQGLSFFLVIALGVALVLVLTAAPRPGSSNMHLSSGLAAHTSGTTANSGGPASSASVARNGDNNVALTISSKSFSNGGAIPKKSTCDGEDVSPDLSWNEAPAGTRSFALLVDDPDAPVGNWNHWTLWNAPPESHGLPAGTSKVAQLADGTQQGLNDFRKIGYNGPCPPPGKPDRYYFKLFALDTKLTLKEKSGKRELEGAMKDRILGQVEWMGQYGRK